LHKKKNADASGEPITGKKGQPILPKGGDIALGFNAVPMFDWMLITISNNANNQIPTTANAAQYTNNSSNQIVGKYYLDPTTAVRVRFGVNTISGSVTNRVQDAVAMATAINGTSEDIAAARLIRVEDKMTFKKMNSQISIGIEKRRGYGRLQGFYGAEIGIGRASSSQKVAYGNAFSDEYSVEYTSNFGNGVSAATTATQSPAPGSRVSRSLEAKFQTGMRYGVRAFVGVEYFFLPKMSVGAEFGWGFSGTSNGNQKTKSEVYYVGNNGPSVVIEDENIITSNKSRGFSIDNNTNQILSLNNTTNVTNNNTNPTNQSLNTGFVGSASAAIILLFHF